MINLKILIWGDDPRLCKRALNPIANVLIKERRGELPPRRRRCIDEQKFVLTNACNFRKRNEASGYGEIGFLYEGNCGAGRIRDTPA